MIDLQSAEDVGCCGPEDLECKICYWAYDLGGRRPKVLQCRHRLCAKCLAKIQDLGESPPNVVVCPFCRDITRLPGEAAGGLPDDRNLVALLSLHSRNQRNQRNLHLQQETTTELLLSPKHLSSLMGSNSPVMSPSSSSSSSATTYSSIRSSPNFVVITIMEPPPASASDQDLRVLNPRYRSSSLDSMASIRQRWTAWTCAALACQASARALVWLLGLLYFSSLPMGVYLLIMQRTTLGVLLVSLVPASLVTVMVYGFCQCVFHEFRHCMPP